MLTVGDEASRFARDAMKRAGVRHDDLEVLEFYDNFAIALLLSLELYGFCDRGDASDWPAICG
jgi:hypothetical protein